MEQHLHSGGITRKRLPFSIEAILDENFPRKENRTQAKNFEPYEQKDEDSMIMTESSTQTTGEISCDESALNTQTPRYAWLECSRKNPPKVQSKYEYFMVKFDTDFPKRRQNGGEGANQVQQLIRK